MGWNCPRAGNELSYSYDAQGERIGIVELLKDLADAGIAFKDLHTTQSSLEDIFVGLVHDGSKPT
jgi:ABC-2 type transport system ATP-binding protein